MNEVQRSLVWTLIAILDDNELYGRKLSVEQRAYVARLILIIQAN